MLVTTEQPSVAVLAVVNFALVLGHLVLRGNNQPRPGFVPQKHPMLPRPAPGFVFCADRQPNSLPADTPGPGRPWAFFARKVLRYQPAQKTNPGATAGGKDCVLHRVLLVGSLRL